MAGSEGAKIVVGHVTLQRRAPPSFARALAALSMLPAKGFLDCREVKKESANIERGGPYVLEVPRGTVATIQKMRCVKL
jgi:hypothetical protein